MYAIRRRPGRLRHRQQGGGAIVATCCCWCHNAKRSLRRCPEGIDILRTIVSQGATCTNSAPAGVLALASHVLLVMSTSRRSCCSRRGRRRCTGRHHTPVRSSAHCIGRSGRRCPGVGGHAICPEVGAPPGRQICDWPWPVHIPGLSWCRPGLGSPPRSPPAWSAAIEWMSRPRSCSHGGL